jgi:hypothetical protein
MTISAPMKVEANRGRGRIGRVSFNVEILDCFPDGLKCFFPVYVQLR